MYFVTACKLEGFLSKKLTGALSAETVEALSDSK
jgi:hypothetical protein